MKKKPFKMGNLDFYIKLALYLFAGEEKRTRRSNIELG